MIIRLNYLALENFKSIKKFTLQIDGCSANILGKNGTGKTTVADAFFWLISDADSNYKKSPNPLLVAQNFPKKRTAPAVAKMELQIDAKKVNLEKRYSEKWVKKKGSNTPEFSGHTTEHFFNEVPMTQKKYNDKLAGFINLDLWRCLSDVHYFCGLTTADYRRRVLLDMIGSVDIDEIFSKNDQLEPIKKYFEDRSASDIRKMLQLKKRNINDQIKDIAPRIDELKNSIEDYSDYSPEKIDEQISSLDFEIRKASEDQLVMTGATAVIEKKKEFFVLSSKIEMEKQAHQDKIDRQYLLCSGLKNRKPDLIKNIDDINAQIEQNKASRQELSADYKRIAGKEFKHSERCFACDQELPDDKIVAQREKFNRDKSSQLLMINGKGQVLFKKYEELKRKKDEFKKQLEDLIMDLSVAEKDYDQIKAEPCCIDLLDQLNKIKADIENKTIEQNPSFEKRILDLERKREGLKKYKREYQLSEKKIERIAGHEKRLKQLSRDLELNEKNLFLIDEFSRIRAEQIEVNVSDLFKVTSWQLFDHQINGEIKKICEPLCNNIKYSSALNTGARIHVGLDCISTIGKHYDVSMPIFIDNAESITSWPTMDTQIIKLIADAAMDKMELIK